MMSTRDPLQINSHTETEIKGLEKIFHAIEIFKKSGITIMITDNIDF